MNKDPLGGGMGKHIGERITEAKKEGEDKEEKEKILGRVVMVGKRKVVKGKPHHSGTKPKLVLGNKADVSLMASRACPDVQSPKRPTPMEVDVPTPPKRKRRSKPTNIPSPNQKLITEVWRQGMSDVGNLRDDLQ